MCHKEGTESQYEVEKVVCNDIENDPHNGNWKEEALSRGYQSLIALTLKKSGKVIGNFNFTPVRKLLMLKKLNY
jgi:hypothetical protein